MGIVRLTVTFLLGVLTAFAGWWVGVTTEKTSIASTFLVRTMDDLNGAFSAYSKAHGLFPFVGPEEIRCNANTFPAIMDELRTHLYAASADAAIAGYSVIPDITKGDAVVDDLSGKWDKWQFEKCSESTPEGKEAGNQMRKGLASVANFLKDTTQNLSVQVKANPPSRFP